MLALVTATTLSRDEEDEDEPLLLAAMRARGVEVEMASWNDPSVRWARYDRVVVRSTRNSVHARGRWNSDEAYLVRYAERGIATVPTVLVPRGSTAVLRSLVSWPEAVVKPRVSTGSFETCRVSLDDVEGRLARCASERDVLVQPHVRSVDGHDERRFTTSVLADVEEPLLYARGDLARADDGTPLLMELELVEPSLLLRHDAAALARFADVLARV